MTQCTGKQSMHFHCLHCQQQHRYRTRIKALLIAMMLTPLVATAQSSKPDCQCRAPGGQMRDLGSVECVDIVGQKSLMICVMSTNTPYWKKVENSNGCPA